MKNIHIKSKMKPNTKSNAKSNTKTNTKTNGKTNAKADAKRNIDLSENKSANPYKKFNQTSTQPNGNPNTKSGTNQSTKPGMKTSSYANTKLGLKPSTLTAKPNTKRNANLNTNQNKKLSSKLNAMTSLKTKSSIKSNTQLSAKPGANATTMPGTNFSTKPYENSSSKTTLKPSTRLSAKQAAKPTTKPSTKQNTKLSDKPRPKPSMKVTTKPNLKPAAGLRTKPNVKEQSCLTVVEANELLKFLFAQLPQKSRSSTKALLEHGQISVDGKVTTQFNHPLLPGQQVFINWNKVYREKSQPLGLKILFEDDYIIIIEKPAGMLSIATDQEKELTAYNALSSHVKKRDGNNRIFIVHRLDRETSGVMMFAKSEEIKETLQNNWKDIVLERSYTVVVEGRVTNDQGTITSWLKENKALRMYSSRTPNDGQKAVTHYRVLERSSAYSLLEVNLETGRKNQIRIHMQDLGHSVAGDLKYGGTKISMNRLALHAHILAFKHPVTQENMHFESPIPKLFLGLFHNQQDKS